MAFYSIASTANVQSVPVAIEPCFLKPLHASPIAMNSANAFLTPVPAQLAQMSEPRLDTGSTRASRHGRFRGPRSNEIFYTRREDGVYVKMLCPVCKKELFGNMQGFVNHCRIVHKKEFPTHDAAVREVGIPVVRYPLDSVWLDDSSKHFLDRTKVRCRWTTLPARRLQIRHHTL